MVGKYISLLLGELVSFVEGFAGEIAKICVQKQRAPSEDRALVRTVALYRKRRQCYSALR